jgi:hypothetical protein
MAGYREKWAEIFVLKWLPILGKINLQEGRNFVHQSHSETLIAEVTNREVLMGDENDARGPERTNANRRSRHFEDQV